MRKSTITRTWLAGLVAVAGGLAIVAFGIGFMLGYGGTFTASPTGEGYDFVPSLDGVFWSAVTAVVIGFAIAAAGGLVQLVAWVGALMNTYRLQDKTWFAAVLIGGAIGLAAGFVGLATMVAYVVAGPDGTQAATPTPVSSRPPSLVPAG